MTYGQVNCLLQIIGKEDGKTGIPNDPYYSSKLKATEYLGKTEMKDYVNESRDLKTSKN